jgi:hypothetical protein
MDNTASTEKQALFHILPEFEKIYEQNCIAGKSFLSSKNIVITGLIRNVGDKLESNLQSLNFLEENSKSVKYFLYENDSSDNTVEILNSTKSQKNNFYFKSETLNLPKFGSVKNKKRTEALSSHRNTCLKYIENNWSDSDYVIVIDLDFKMISINGILNTFGLFQTFKFIDAMAGNSFELKTMDMQNPNYKQIWNYDSWAYRGNWWEDLHKYPECFKNYDPMLWFGHWHPPIGSPPIPANSAFGGCCIYKTSKFISGRYEGHDCEHVCFHKNIFTNHGLNLYINPSQIMLFN